MPALNLCWCNVFFAKSANWKFPWDHHPALPRAKFSLQSCCSQVEWYSFSPSSFPTFLLKTWAPQHYLIIRSFGQWAVWFQILDFWRKPASLSMVGIWGIDHIPFPYNPFDLWLLPDTWAHFPPDSFILFHLLGIMFTYNNTVRTYWGILCALVNVFSFACRGGFLLCSPPMTPYSCFQLSPQLCLQLNTFFFFFSLLQVIICMEICI